MSRKLNLPYRFLFFWLDIFRLTRNDSNEESGSSFYLSPAVCSTWTLLACFSGFPCPFPIIVFVESLISIFKLSMTCVLFIICLSSNSVIYCQSRYNLFSQSPICPSQSPAFHSIFGYEQSTYKQHNVTHHHYFPLRLAISQSLLTFLMKRLERWFILLATTLKREQSSTLVTFFMISGSHTFPQIRARSIISRMLIKGFSFGFRCVVTLNASTLSFLLFLADYLSICSTVTLLSSSIMLLQWKIKASVFSTLTSMPLMYSTLIKFLLAIYSTWRRFCTFCPSSEEQIVVVSPSVSQCIIFQFHSLIRFSSTSTFHMQTRSSCFPCFRIWQVPILIWALSFMLSRLVDLDFTDIQVSISPFSIKKLIKSYIQFSSDSHSKIFCRIIELKPQLKINYFLFIYCMIWSNLPVFLIASQIEQFRVLSRQLQVLKTSVSSRQVIKTLGLIPFCENVLSNAVAFSRVSSCLLRSVRSFLSFCLFMYSRMSPKQPFIKLSTLSAQAFSYLKGLIQLKLASISFFLFQSSLIHSFSRRNSIIISTPPYFWKAMNSPLLKKRETFLTQQVQSKQALCTMRLQNDLSSMLGISQVKGLKTRPCWCLMMLVRNQVFSCIRRQSSAMSLVSTSSALISQ